MAGAEGAADAVGPGAGSAAAADALALAVSGAAVSAEARGGGGSARQPAREDAATRARRIRGDCIGATRGAGSIRPSRRERSGSVEIELDLAQAAHAAADADPEIRPEELGREALGHAPRSDDGLCHSASHGGARSRGRAADLAGAAGGAGGVSRGRGARGGRVGRARHALESGAAVRHQGRCGMRAGAPRSSTKTRSSANDAGFPVNRAWLVTKSDPRSSNSRFAGAS
jgi:hypothetical protein